MAVGLVVLSREGIPRLICPKMSKLRILPIIVIMKKAKARIAKPIKALVILLRALPTASLSPPDIIHWNAPITNINKTAKAATIKMIIKILLIITPSEVVAPIPTAGGVNPTVIRSPSAINLSISKLIICTLQLLCQASDHCPAGPRGIPGVRGAGNGALKKLNPAIVPTRFTIQKARARTTSPIIA